MKQWTLFLCMILLMLSQLNADLYLPSLPSMRLALLVDAKAVQWSTLIATAAFGLSLFWWGPLVDSVGRRRVALWGIFIFIVGGLWCANADGFSDLMVGRVLQGLGVGCTGALSPVIPQDLFSGQQLVKAFSLLSMAMGVYPIVAQIAGGLLEEAYGWQSTFYAMSFMGAIVWCLYFFTFKETAPSIRRSMNVYGIVKSYGRLVFQRSFCSFVLLMTLIYAGEIAYNMASPFILQEQYHLSPTQNGLMTFFTGGGLLIGALLSARLSAKLSSVSLIKLGLVLVFCSILWVVTLARWGHGGAIAAILPMMLYMIGAGLLYPNCINMVMATSNQDAGITGSLMSAFQMIGAASFSFLLSFFYVTKLAALAQMLVALGLLLLASLYLFSSKGLLRSGARASLGTGLEK